MTDDEKVESNDNNFIASTSADGPTYVPLLTVVMFSFFNRFSDVQLIYKELYILICTI